MTTDPEAPYVDPADVAEQQQDVVTSPDDDPPDLDPAELPLEVDEADFLEQRTDASGDVDDDVTGN